MELHKKILEFNQISSQTVNLDLTKKWEVAKQKSKKVMNKVGEVVTDAKETFDKKVDEMKLKAVKATKTAKDAVVSHTLLASNAVVEGQDLEEYVSVLSVIGKSPETISYVLALKKSLDLKSTQVVDVINSLKTANWAVADIIRLSPDDFRAVYEVYKLGQLREDMDFYDVFRALTPVKTKITTWYMDAITLLAVKVACDPDDLNAILHGYVMRSANAIKDSNALVIRILKYCLLILTGIPLPRLNTLYLSVLWYSMLYAMSEKAGVSVANLASVAFSLTVSMLLHLGKQTISDVVSLMVGETSSRASALLRKYGIEEEDKNTLSQQYQSWKSVMSVLIDKPSLTTEDAMRVLSTYSIGKSFIRCMTLNPSPELFFTEFLAMPTTSFTEDIFSFLRGYDNYESRISKMLERRLSRVTDATSAEQRKELAYWAYMDGLKIWIAFSSRTSVESDVYYYDPGFRRIQKDIFDVVAQRFAFNSETGDTNLYGFRRDLTILIVSGVKGKDPEEATVEGKPVLKKLNRLMTILYGTAILGILKKEFVGIGPENSDTGYGAFSKVPSSECGMPFVAEDAEHIEEQYRGITFGSSQSQIKTDINYYQSKLETARGDINYYSRELRRNNLSKTYRDRCDGCLQDAIDAVKELTKTIEILKKELSS